MKVALYSGIIIERDAISGSVRRKIDLLRGEPGRQLGIEPIAFCQHSNVDDPAIRAVGDSVLDLARHPDFTEAALHIFEFGIHYNLFNASLLLPERRMAAVYHNITPRELVTDPLAQQAVDRAMTQKNLLFRMSHIGCVSEYNRRDLIDFGLPEEKLSIVPLPALTEVRPGRPRGTRPADDPIQFLFVGRLVRAKGVGDLLRAAWELADSGETGFRIRVIGPSDFSDPETSDYVLRTLEDPRLGRLVSCSRGVSSTELAAAYTDADVLVMPSYHEGFCLPVIEAFSAGCPVIAYDNSNLPYVTAGLAPLVPTGDVSQLAAAMRTMIERLRRSRSGQDPFRVPTASGDLPEEKWRDCAEATTRDLPEIHDRSFLHLVRQLLAQNSDLRV